MRALSGARLAAALAIAVAALAAPAAGFAADPPSIVVADGVTQPVFSYADAIRERVWIPVPGVDQNSDGVPDRVAVDIIRPQETNAGLKVPAIIDTSPYYTSLGRGNETEFLHSTAAGYADKFPLFYDNYFVPRGYAFIAAQAVGTGVVDRLSDARRARRHRRLQGRHRLAPRPRARLQQPHDERHARRRRLGQRQERDVRQVLRRHVRERRRRDGRRGPDHDRADLGDLRLVRLLALERDPAEHRDALPGEPLEHDHREHERAEPRRRAAVEQRRVRCRRGPR